ncbi:4Fe-4S binding protein [Vibrio sp. SM6]|uniref:4Fe-4S binding protein n=1 Tax=Vibrio agarilyticus TaxID=2726741 RepID=A0A7X8YGE2_9VIBR|nr:4Fe-4S binding protein [Vibrio agarilyticus]NLS12594.1 4Fe-4S binding protein [Vibrio agarilyticus]
MLKQQLEQCRSSNGRARFAALEMTVELANLIPPTVSYQSRGRTLLVGAASTIDSLLKHADIVAALERLPSVTLLSLESPPITQIISGKREHTESAIDSTSQARAPSNSVRFSAPKVELTGYLGAFSAYISTELAVSSADSNQPVNSTEQHKVDLAQLMFARTSGGEPDAFDIVVDLCMAPLMNAEVAAPGYYHLNQKRFNDPATQPDEINALMAILTELLDMVGSFDKPKYFRLDTDICAHSSRGVKGCERCLDACPAGAISSEGSEARGHRIVIDPYLCQGIGSCATRCPTEAILYALPDPKETQLFVERLLANYANAGGVHPKILFYSPSSEAAISNCVNQISASILPIMVEESASIGIDTWFAALVNGAEQLIFALDRDMPETSRRVFLQEIALARTLLKAAITNEHNNAPTSERLIVLDVSEDHDDNNWSSWLTERTAALSNDKPLLDSVIGELQGNKRARLFTALDTLYNHDHGQVTKESKVTSSKSSILPLESTAPYGRVNCVAADCTLCMSCVSVCPTRALHTDGQSPSLQFIEQDCVQCGLCVKACPESVLSLEPRINWNALERQAATVIKQETAAECLICHKPFAPQSIITRLQEKLKGHSHFSNEAALRRIAMCEDCRVIDMVKSLADDPTKQVNL